MNKDEEFMIHLLETYRIEANEHLNEMMLLLVALEKSEMPLEEKEKIETIYRCAHSLKGASRAVDQEDIEEICQHLETVFSYMKKKTIRLSESLFNSLQETLDFIAYRVSHIENPLSQEDKDLEVHLIKQLKEIPNESETVVVETGVVETVVAENVQEKMNETSRYIPKTHASDLETLRVSSAKLSSVLLQAEEMLAAKLSANQSVKNVKNIQMDYLIWKKEWSKVFPEVNALKSMNKDKMDFSEFYKDTEKRHSLNKVLEFMEWNYNFIKKNEAAVHNLYKETQQNSLDLDGMVDNLLEDMKKVIMFPFSSLLEMMPKLVRDLSKDIGKNVELVITGEELEIDRRILDEMRDPIIHIIRNCIDHGIETPQERRHKNKPVIGTVKIEIVPRDHQVELIISDDGAGISKEQVKLAIKKNGSITDEHIATLTDQQLMSYIYNSGVSTSQIITELSGRGLGLAIVREKVEKLSGSITFESKVDVGTKFHIILPPTVANFRGILISIGEQEFILPTMYVERIMRIKPELIMPVENRETICLDDRPLSLLRLSKVIGISHDEKLSDGYFRLVILSANETRIACMVENIHFEQEVLFRNLGPQLTRVKNISGATVLGNGRVVPILNVPDLIISSSNYSGVVENRINNSKGIENKNVKDKDVKDKDVKSGNAVNSILVVEDSITTRTLLKNILESAGYLVQTAVDGIDALTKIRCNQYDVVLSDVDMPRMDGFALTENIRKDTNNKDIPIILITALSSREDQERGIEAGANAYIIKSMFDQSNLLNVIEMMLSREN